ncbi:hypothetical protein [Prevotella fusca]|uniref:Uncharacterized protein n=1 Tax=Prevotella fusca JCM 17724 TaxID=1236517 RepID=A0A0K1NIT1_9BACT|nr:hypothetical protein [Prevotella fusca]AKU68992.1 hypothetical protein ADJ77_03985 [Prevotella fusca JCM 17724]QUB86616.1 hypothetical protein J5A51_11105 [Prevotella fusca JCM 17724]
MRKLLLVALVCLVSATSFAREGVTTVVVSRDTIFYNHQMKVVADRDAAAYYRLLAKENYKGEERNIFQDFYPSGHKRLEGGYSFLDLGNDANTVLDGRVVSYYPNGKEKWHCNYKNGKRHGYLTLNLRDGSIGVVAYTEGQKRFNYMMVTHPDGKMEKVSLKQYEDLLQ